MSTIQEDSQQVSTLAGAGGIMHRLSNMVSSIGDEFDRRYRVIVDREALRTKRQRELAGTWSIDAVKCEQAIKEFPGTPHAHQAAIELRIYEKCIKELRKAMEI